MSYLIPIALLFFIGLAIVVFLAMIALDPTSKRQLTGLLCGRVVSSAPRMPSQRW